MATISNRNGRWQVKIRKKGQRTLTKTFLNHETAERWARKTESEMERGLYLDDSDSGRTTTLDEAALRFGKEHLDRLRHGNREKNRLAALLERTGWGPLSLSNLKGKDVSSYTRQREEEGFKPDTIRLDLAILSRLYKHAIQDWSMEALRNPVDVVRRPSLRGTARTRRLEQGEEELLLKAAHQDLKPVILFALETAMRREEIATLTWSNVDLKKRLAHLPKTKNGEARTVPLTNTAAEILKNIPRQLKGTVFGLTKDQITDRMRTTVKRSGLKDLRFHDLRHEATSRLFERNDLDMMEVASITGHKTMHMLKRYTHLRAETLAKKLGKI
nr:site-specific integrase [uncultured Desulfuromonas sp.]